MDNLLFFFCPYDKDKNPLWILGIFSPLQNVETTQKYEIYISIQINFKKHNEIILAICKTGWH